MKLQTRIKEKLKYLSLIFQIKYNKIKYIKATIKYSQDHNKVTFPETEIKLHGRKFKTRKNTVDIAHLSGIYEGSTTKFIINSRPKIFIDVGAHIGRYTVLAAKNANVIAFEASKENFKILSENVKLNKLEHKIKLNNIGISNKKGKRNFFYNPIQSGMSSLIENKKRIAEEIITNTLDNLLDSTSSNYKLDKKTIVKIDTEGTELDILKGSKKILRKENITWIIEITEQQLENKIIEFLKQYNYKCTKILDGRNYIFEKSKI